MPVDSVLDRPASVAFTETVVLERSRHRPGVSVTRTDAERLAARHASRS